MSKRMLSAIRILSPIRSLRTAQLKSSVTHASYKIADKCLGCYRGSTFRRRLPGMAAGMRLRPSQHTQAITED